LQHKMQLTLESAFLFIEKLFNYLWTLYIEVSKGYTPEGSIEKNYLLATPKRNLLLRRK
jgi:hypothetical protein